MKTEIKDIIKGIRTDFSWGLYATVFACICANFLLLSPSGGEEQYLGLALQWSNAEWLPNSFSFTEFPGTRLIFQAIIAPILEVFSFENSVLILRVINYALISLPLALLLRVMGVSWWMSFLSLQTFFILGQNILGGEWIVKSFEPKSVAYIFSLMGVYFFLKQRTVATVLLLALSCYFHFLVGGWVLIVLGIIMLIQGKWKEALIGLGVFILTVLPFGIYLYSGYFGSEEAEAFVSADWVYCYYRLPHHLGIFKNYDFFIQESLLSVIISGMLLVLTFWLKKWKELSAAAILIIQVALSLNLLFVAAAWVDGILLEQRASFLIKYYPFRSNSLALMLVIFSIATLAQSKLKSSTHTKSIRLTALALSAILFLFTMRVQWSDSNQYKSDQNWLEALEYAKNNTSVKSVFSTVDIPVYDGKLTRFSRLSKRNMMVVYKLTPASKTKIVEWYDRLRLTTRLENNKASLNRAINEYGLTHIISASAIDIKGSELIFKNDSYNIYTVK